MGDADFTPERSQYSFGFAFRLLMQSRGINAKILAKDIGISEAALSKILNNKVLPRLDTFHRLVSALCETEADKRSVTMWLHGSTKAREQRALRLGPPVFEESRYADPLTPFETDIAYLIKDLGAESALKRAEVFFTFILQVDPRIGIFVTKDKFPAWHTVLGKALIARHKIEPAMAIVIVAAVIDEYGNDLDPLFRSQRIRLTTPATFHEALKAIAPSLTKASNFVR